MHNSRDFRDLLVDSQRLAASTSNNDVSLGGGRNNLRRGIAELEEASRYLASGNERQTKTSRSMDEFHSRLDVIGHRPTIRQSTPAVTFEVPIHHYPYSVKFLLLTRLILYSLKSSAIPIWRDTCRPSKIRSSIIWSTRRPKCLRRTHAKSSIDGLHKNGNHPRRSSWRH